MKPQELAMPLAKRFSDLFGKPQSEQGSLSGAGFPFRDYGWNHGRGSWEKDEEIRIGPFVHFSLRRRGGKAGFHFGHGSLYADPTDQCADAVRRTMLAAGVNDRITFEIVDHGDSLLVIAKNSVIIGSRWLAKIEPVDRPVLSPFLYDSKAA